MVSRLKPECVPLPPCRTFWTKLIQTILESGPAVDGCNCQECVDNREKIHRSEHPSLLKPGLSPMYVAAKSVHVTGLKQELTLALFRALGVLFGWLLFAIVLYFILSNSTVLTVYDPFTILGINPVSTGSTSLHLKRLIILLECYRQGNQKVLQKISCQIVSSRRA